ncbi:hypothetical protein BT69DRAFT_1285529, partial [Atractiella rhizophila]
MVEKYLVLQDDVEKEGKAKEGTAPPPPEGDYVYDVYYPDLTPASTDVGDQNDVGSLAGLQRIGIVAGLEDGDILVDENNADTDEEAPDEADEDSNDEDFYRNDYPEGEDDEDDESDVDSEAGYYRKAFRDESPDGADYDYDDD